LELKTAVSKQVVWYRQERNWLEVSPINLAYGRQKSDIFALNWFIFCRVSLPFIGIAFIGIVASSKL
jgi:hypothetical protein